VAFAVDGAVLVSDTSHGKVLRFDRTTGKRTTFATVAEPRGLAVAPDGTVYVVEAAAKKIGVFTRSGLAKRSLPARFRDPYAIAVSGNSLYVVDTAAAGTVRRISR
jgi:streptogramin lyase